MRTTRTIASNGDGQNKPKRKDDIVVEYTGYLYDPNEKDNGYRGIQFDTSKGRGDHEATIGAGTLIWDGAILDMSLGEASTLTITAWCGFPGVIPPNATIIVDVLLKGSNEKRISPSPRIVGRTYTVELHQLPREHVPLIVKLIIRDETTKEIDYSKLETSEYTLTANATITVKASLIFGQLYFVFSRSGIDSSRLTLSLKTPDYELSYAFKDPPKSWKRMEESIIEGKLLVTTESR